MEQPAQQPPNQYQDEWRPLDQVQQPTAQHLPPPPHYGATSGSSAAADPRIPNQRYPLPAPPPQQAQQVQPQGYGSQQQPYSVQPGYPQPTGYPQASGYPQPYPAPQTQHPYSAQPAPQAAATPYAPAPMPQPAVSMPFPTPPGMPPTGPQAGWPQPAPAQPQPYGQQPYPSAPPNPQLQPQPSAAFFPAPPNLPPVRDAFRDGAAPFLEPGEQVYYGFVLKLDDTIEPTPRELQIAIEGQHRTLGDIHRTSRKINRGMRWMANPLDAAAERLAEKGTAMLNQALAGPVFVGGWQSQAGEFIRFVRATSEDYGPGAFGCVSSHRYLVFRAARLGGSAMRLVYAVPRTAVAGVRLEGSKDALLHGRSPRAELHFTDGSMVATMMATKQGEQLAAVLQPQLQPGGGY